MGSAALAAAVPHQSKAIWISRKGQGSTKKKKKKIHWRHHLLRNINMHLSTVTDREWQHIFYQRRHLQEKKIIIIDPVASPLWSDSKCVVCIPRMDLHLDITRQLTWRWRTAVELSVWREGSTNRGFALINRHGWQAVQYQITDLGLLCWFTQHVFAAPVCRIQCHL